jgi:hypothetical protein
VLLYVLFASEGDSIGISPQFNIICRDEDTKPLLLNSKGMTAAPKFTRSLSGFDPEEPMRNQMIEKKKQGTLQLMLLNENSRKRRTNDSNSSVSQGDKISQPHSFGFHWYHTQNVITLFQGTVQQNFFLASKKIRDQVP